MPLVRVGERVKVTVPTSGNYYRLYVTAAPFGSSLRSDLGDSTRYEVASGDSGQSYEFTPDLPGSYVFAVEEITRTGASGGYLGAPTAQPTETIDANSTLTVAVAEQVQITLGSGQHTAVLGVWVQGDTLYDPEILSATPGLGTDAAESLDLSGLDEITAAAAVGSVSAVLEDMVRQYNAHIASLNYHANLDTTYNVVSPGFYGSVSGGANQLRLMLDRHMRDDDGDGTAARAFHDVSTGKKLDWEHLPGNLSAGTAASSAIPVIVDLWRAFEAHRQSTNSHVAADTSNALTALPPLLQVQHDFIAATRTSTAAPTSNSGVVLLANEAGATRI